MKKQRTKEEKKWFKIKLISSLIFLIIGLCLGIISLVANGWNIVDFITNPTVDLVILILFCLIIFCVFSNSERK